MGIKTYEDVMKASTQKSGIKTYEELFGNKEKKQDPLYPLFTDSMYERYSAPPPEVELMKPSPAPSTTKPVDNYWEQKNGITTYEDLFNTKQSPLQDPLKTFFNKSMYERYTDLPLEVKTMKLSPIKPAQDDYDYWEQTYGDYLDEDGNITTPWLEKHPILKKYIFDPLGRFNRWYTGTPVGKFHNRASQTAVDILTATDTENKVSTGSPVADTIASGIGTVGGFVANPAGSGTSIGSFLNKAGQPIEYGARKLLTQAPAKVPQIVTKAAPVVARGAVEGGLYGFGSSIARGENTGEALKQGGIDALFGVVLDPLIVLGIPALGQKLVNGAKKAINKFKGVDNVDPDTIAKDVAKDIGVDWDYMNDAQRQAIRKVVQNMQTAPVQSGQLLTTSAGQNFTFRDTKLSDNIGNIAVPEGKLKAISKQARIANEKLKETIEDVQNEFMTNELRANEMEYVKNQMGIDLDKLADDVIKAEDIKPLSDSNLKEIAEQARWKRIVGLEMPNLVRGRRKAAEQARWERIVGVEMPKPVKGKKKGKLEQPQLKPLEFKQTIEVPKVYDKHAFTGINKTRAQIKDEIINFKRGNDPLSQFEPPIKTNSFKQPTQPMQSTYTTQPIKTAQITKAEIDRIKSLHDTVKSIESLKEKGVYTSKSEQVLKEAKRELKAFNAARKEGLDNWAKELTANSDKWKDKSGMFGMLRLERETAERNIIDIAGQKDGQRIIDEIFTPIHKNEAEFNKYKNKIRTKAKKLNLTNREKEWTQALGEGKINEIDIPEASRKKVKKAVEVYRQIYDEAFEQVNDALIRNGYTPIQKLENYFPHFTEDDPIFKALGIRLDAVELPTDINGLTHQFKPGKNWSGHLLHRKGNKTAYNVEEGLDRYLESVGKVMYHTDDIQRLRAYIRSLRTKYADEAIGERIQAIIHSDLPPEMKDSAIDEITRDLPTKLSNYVADLEEYTNVLAGKKDLGDRATERLLGRAMYNVSKFMTDTIAKNLVAVNPGSWLTNFIPITQSLATTNKKAVKQALNDTMRNLVQNDGFVNRSTFLSNRVGSDPLNLSATEKITNILAAPFKWIDQFTANVVTRAKYIEGINKGIDSETAMLQADRWAANIMGDRSAGALPTIFNQRNPLLRLFTQFQVEVNNQLSFALKDIPKEILGEGVNAKSIAKLSSAGLQLAFYGYLYNVLYNQVVGRDVALDPIGVAFDFYKDINNPNLSKTETAGRAVKNVLNYVPFASSLAYGGRLPVTPVYENIIKSGTEAVKALSGETEEAGLKKTLVPLGKAALYLNPIGGGSQIIKTVEGVNAYQKGGSYSNEKLRYPIKQSLPNALKTAVFGQYSTPEAKEYFDNNRRFLGEEQTKAFEYAKERGIDPQVMYDLIQQMRTLEPLEGRKGVTNKQKKAVINKSGLPLEQRKLLIKLFVDTSEGKRLIERQE